MSLASALECVGYLGDRGANIEDCKQHRPCVYEGRHILYRVAQANPVQNGECFRFDGLLKVWKGADYGVWDVGFRASYRYMIKSDSPDQIYADCDGHQWNMGNFYRRRQNIRTVDQSTILPQTERN